MELKDAIKASELTITELAKRSGLTRKAIHSLLRGASFPNASTIEALSKVLDIQLYFKRETRGVVFEAWTQY